VWIKSRRNQELLRKRARGHQDIRKNGSGLLLKGLPLEAINPFEGFLSSFVTHLPASIKLPGSAPAYLQDNSLREKPDQHWMEGCWCMP
jgi:hypothetical protein